MQHFYRRRVAKMENFISPEFSYQSPAVMPVDFTGFVKHCNYLFQNTFVKINHIQTQNDQSFLVDYHIHIQHKSLETACLLPGKAKVLIVDNLIKKIIVSYDPLFIGKPKNTQKTVHYF